MSQGFIVGKGGGMNKGAVKKGTIVVTYPEGSTCTVTDVNGKTYAALDTSGAAAFVVDPGTWTVKATQGDDSDSEGVTVKEGDFATVEVSFVPEGALYWYGSEFEEKTGGWTSSATKPDSGYSYAIAPTINRGETSIEFIITSSSSPGGGLAHTTNKINLAPYSVLYVSAINLKSRRKYVLVPSKTTASWASDTPQVFYEGTEPTIISLDITSVNEERYVAIGLGFNNSQTNNKGPVGMTIDRIWLE